MKKTLFLSVLLSLATLAAHAQTQYSIDQPLNAKIQTIQVGQGWQVNIIHDTVNMISLITPCEHFFDEGNEPRICTLTAESDFGNRLVILNNSILPATSTVLLRLRDTLSQLILMPHSTVQADTLHFSHNFHTNYHDEIKLYPYASLSADFIECGLIQVDSNATVHINTIHRNKLITLHSKYGSTLQFDSIDSPNITIYRHPTSKGLPQTDIPAKNIKVKTGSFWFIYGMKQLTGSIGIDWNRNSSANKFNCPYAISNDLTVTLGLISNIIPFSNWGGFSFGLDIGAHTMTLKNNVTPEGRLLALDNTNPGINRQNSLFYISIGAVNRLHYVPHTSFLRLLFYDLHLGLTPTFNFGQLYMGSLLTSDNHWEKLDKKRISAIRPFQLRFDVGLRLQQFRNIEFNFYVDLLPTYRQETGFGSFHSIGTQIRF